MLVYRYDMQRDCLIHNLLYTARFRSDHHDNKFRLADTMNPYLITIIYLTICKDYQALIFPSGIYQWFLSTNYIIVMASILCSGDLYFFIMSRVKKQCHLWKVLAVERSRKVHKNLQITYNLENENWIQHLSRNFFKLKKMFILAIEATE